MKISTKQNVKFFCIKSRTSSHHCASVKVGWLYFGEKSSRDNRQRGRSVYDDNEKRDWMWAEEEGPETRWTRERERERERKKERERERDQLTFRHVLSQALLPFPSQIFCSSVSWSRIEGRPADSSPIPIPIPQISATECAESGSSLHVLYEQVRFGLKCLLTGSLKTNIEPTLTKFPTIIWDHN